MPKLIVDQFSSMPVSRQTKYKLRRQEKGLCPICGDAKEADCSTYACGHCTWLNTLRMKEQRGKGFTIHIPANWARARIPHNPVLDLI